MFFPNSFGKNNLLIKIDFSIFSFLITFFENKTLF